MRALLLLAVAACHVAALAAIASRGHGTIAARARPIVVALLAPPEPAPPRSSPSNGNPTPSPSTARQRPPGTPPAGATARPAEPPNQARPAKTVATRQAQRPAAPRRAASKAVPVSPMPATPVSATPVSATKMPAPPMPAPPVPASPEPASPEPVPTTPNAMARPEPPPEPGPDPAASARAATAAQQPFTPARYDGTDPSNRRPHYPLASRRMGEQGTVVLRVDVSAEGSVDKLDIETSSGSNRLDRAATSTVAQWRFQPARRGSVAVASTLPIRIVFRLED